jgi:hypothetical protein
MRQWLVNPRMMCRNHLLGEHLENHMFVSHIMKGKKVEGYIKNNLLEPESLKKRHEELVQEMIRRGYNHQSPLPNFSLENFEFRKAKINREKAFRDLINRCPECSAKYLFLCERK